MNNKLSSCTRVSVLAILFLSCRGEPLSAEEIPQLGERLTDSQVAAFANLAIKNIETEYPNKLSHVWTGQEASHHPRDLHPVFYGSFDWHSCVHGHWMLVRLLKLYPEAPTSAATRALLNKQFNPQNLQREAEYFDTNPGYERMYGWAWTFKLAQELRTWDDPEAQQWATALQPLEKKLVAAVHDYLPRLTYPVRAGVHRDTAFALYMILDYARSVQDSALEQLLLQYARDKFGNDTNFPFAYEPSGQDFFSAGMNEADLMRRVLPPEEFSAWLSEFVPRLVEADTPTGNFLQPAVVSDLTDPKIVHLVGLNLSRGWTLRGVASALPSGDPRRNTLEQLARTHSEAGLKFVFSGHYEGEHWLASFAIYLLTDAGISSK